MVKRTQKYLKALDVDEAKNFSHQSSDELYKHLQGLGYYWDSNCQNWIFAPGMDNEPPSPIIKLRIMADGARVEDLSKKISELLESEGYRVLDKSSPYPCRPPNCYDSRIYLSFNYPNH